MKSSKLVTILTTCSLIACTELQPGDTFSDCPDCPTMVVIEAGTFLQGSPEGEPESGSEERPTREVNIQTFAMAQTTVTVDQWNACVDHGGCSSIYDDGAWGNADSPITFVSWHDAQQYTTWLSKRTGHEYRLPSESEWEYATRAGTTGRFNTGHCITTSQANFQGERPAEGCPPGINRDQILPVASFAPNAFGLYDTHGNVWEWVQDCWNDTYADFGGAPKDGSAWLLGNCSEAVLRGGSWLSNGRHLRSATRGSSEPSGDHHARGFRVARSMTP